MKISTIYRPLFLILLTLSVCSLQAQRKKKADADVLLQQSIREGRAANYDKAVELAKAGLAVSPAYTDLRLQLAQLYRRQGNYTAAIEQYRLLLAKEPGNREAQTGLAGSYEAAGNYEEALAVYKQLSERSPADTAYLLKQFGILELQKEFDQAAVISHRLISLYPSSPRFQQLDAYALLSAAQIAEKENRTEAAVGKYKSLLDAYPGDGPALKGLAGVYEKQGDLEQALLYYEKAYGASSQDSSYLQKKIALYDALQQYGPAVETILKLKTAYGSTDQRTKLERYLRLALADQLIKKDSLQAATAQLDQVLETSPGETEALLKKASVSLKQQQYGTALQTYDRLLEQSPGDSNYLLKKAGIYELQKEYRQAAATIRPLTTQYPASRRFRELYRSYQSNVQEDNQIGVLHMQSFYNLGIRTASISSLQYLRRLGNNRKSTVIGRINYANRAFGDGVQFEAESYISHNKKQYSFLNAAFSNSTVFPKFKAAYSFNQGLGKGWELEVGARYLRAAELDIYSGILGFTKEYDNDWLNLKNYVLRDSASWYHAHVFTWRHMVNEKRDYFSVILGLGTSPDDRSRNFAGSSFSTSNTTSAGLGYAKKLGLRSLITVSGVWNQQRLLDKRRLNQVDLYLNFFRDF
ncbi:tetratricopeptide repeat protein [Niabella beijingensis]|uniref:tetratricopeptide repeat protein n=1 Tax=Niabella beijingensis TaxID=2872700 RepID=UPI001CBED20D|nr:tetratricopeptide repeat protein [Niabella beijingensis]MBZ4188327.1 YaiO family outer membrane beta-barrel protein [Niabella beijingensis]